MLKVLLLLALLCSTAPAQFDPSLPPPPPPDIDSPILEVTFSLGFGGYIWNQAVSPVAFQIKNTSPDVFTGSIEIESITYRGAEILRLPVEIGQNSLRRFSLGYGFQNFSEDIRYRIVRGDTTVWQRSHNSLGIVSLPAFSSPPPILAVSPDHTDIRPRDTIPSFNPGSNQGRTIARIAPWELPDHDPILCPVGAIFFSQNVDFPSLTGPRLGALARYLAHGGTLVVPASASAWMAKLLAELPYDVSASTDGPTPVGLGLLIPYSGDPTTLPWAQEDLLDLLPSHPATDFAGHFQNHAYSGYYRERGPQSQNSVYAITLFIAAYLLAAGPCLFFFRKAKRKTIIRLLAVLIAAASALSIALGIFLKSSPGDVRWTSITHVAPGGATQSAILDLSSAGARHHLLDLGVPTASIASSDPIPFSQFSNDPTAVFYQDPIALPFPLKSTSISLTPLGEKRIHARGPISGVKPLVFQSSTPVLDDQSQSLSITATFKNPNPFPILSPIIATHFQGTTIVHTTIAPILPAKAEISGTYNLSNRITPQGFNQNLRSFNPPKPDAPRPSLAPAIPDLNFDTGRITLIGVLKESPAFHPTGDFIEAHGHHYLIQNFPLPK